jgi:hypothetical protein
MSYREYQASPPPAGLAPTWLLRPLGRRWLESLGDQKDWLAGLVKQAIKARMPGTDGAVTVRSNLWAGSEALDGAAWTRSAVTVVPNQDAPDGTTTAERIVEDTTTTYHELYQNLAGVPDNAVVVGSFHVKAGPGITKVAISSVTKASTYPVATFDLTAGTTASPGAAIAAVGNGWFRIWLSMNVLSGAAAPRFSLRLDRAGGGASYLGDGASYCLAWGAQAELGTTPTAYIPTGATGATVTDFTPLCPADALPAIAAERGLPRGVNEPEATYRARLAAAFDQWQWAGTPYGILRALQLAGYPSVIVRVQKAKQYTLAAGGTPADLATSDVPPPVHLGGVPELWNDFAVFVTKPWPSWWNNVPPANGSVEQKNTSALVAKWKPAHARCVRLAAVDGSIWGLNMTWGSFTWGGSIVEWTPPTT